MHWGGLKSRGPFRGHQTSHAAPAKRCMADGHPARRRGGFAQPRQGRQILADSLSRQRLESVAPPGAQELSPLICRGPISRQHLSSRIYV